MLVLNFSEGVGWSGDKDYENNELLEKDFWGGKKPVVGQLRFFFLRNKNVR